MTASAGSSTATAKVTGLPADAAATLAYTASNGATLHSTSASCSGGSCAIFGNGPVDFDVNAPSGTTITFKVEPVQPLTDPAQGNNTDTATVPASATESASPSLSASPVGDSTASASTSLSAAPTPSAVNTAAPTP